MNSKKIIISGGVIALIIYNVLMFLLPFNKNINFWIIYISSITSILFLLGVLYTKLTTKSIESKIKNSSIVWVAWEYFVLQIVIGFIELLQPIYYRNSLIINIILFGINIILISIVVTEKKEIDKVESKIKEKVFFIKLLQDNIEDIKDMTNNETINNKLTDLLETIRYSDPMSSNRLIEIENNIEIKVEELKDNIKEGQIEKIEDIISQIKTLLTQRNRKAKMYKGMGNNEEKEEKPVNSRFVIIFGVFIIVCLIIGIASYYSIIVPNAEYKNAEELLKNKQYIEAKETFEKMSGYKDSDDKVKEAVYRYATELYENKNYEKAEKEFNNILEYKDSEDQKNKLIYEYATELLKNKEYSKAATEYLKLDNYKDSKEKVLEIYNLFGDKDVIYFGTYNGNPIEWQILDTRDQKVLLICKEPIDEMAFNTEYKSTEWENSSIREWLNNTFYNCFDEREKDKLLKNSSESDIVFLLSNDNIKSYTKLKNASKSWWIETSGEDKTKVMYVETNGKINTNGDVVTKLHGVRPSIWLDLN